MTRTTLHGTLLVICSLLMIHALGYAQSAKHDDEPKAPPIELNQIAFSFAVANSAGQLVWDTPQPGAPNTIPAGAQKLRFKAKVNNRSPGTTIRIRAILQELCPSPDNGKPFLARLRHLAESDSTGQLTPSDPADNEVQVIDSSGWVRIEVRVHCDDCVPAICGKQCPGKDHLGEGPHLVTLTTSDEPPPAREQSQAETAAPAKPSSFRVDIKSVCPKSKAGNGRSSTTVNTL